MRAMVGSALRTAGGGRYELQVRHIQEAAKRKHALDHDRGRVGRGEEPHGAPGGNLWWRIFRVSAGRGNRGGIESELSESGSRLNVQQACAAGKLAVLSAAALTGEGIGWGETAL